QDFISIFGLKLPDAISRAPMDYDPKLGKLVSTGTVLDLPAILIAVLVTTILVIGIKESARFNTAMVILKVSVVLLVIGVGAFYVDPNNWHPFAPFGFAGVSFFGKSVLGGADAGGQPLGMLAAAAIIFFAYIGFDSVSTNSEEARNPRRDVPLSLIASLLICTILYIAVTAVLTGMIRYDQLDTNAPVSNAFKQKGLTWAQFLISFGALAGITSVVLVSISSQARILLAMARDGLLPRKFFGAVHEKFRTPWKSTIVTGMFVGVATAFLPLRILADLVSIGTLSAFVIVCAAVLVMRRTNPEAERPFRAPFVPLVPILGIATCLLLMFSLPAENWLRLGVWLLIGFVIYFTYGRHHSLLNDQVIQIDEAHPSPAKAAVRAEAD